MRLPQQLFVEFTLANYRKKLLSDFTEETYFLYNKSNLIKESFITEVNKLISIYGSISNFGNKKSMKLPKLYLAISPLKFDVKKLRKKPL